VQLSVSASLQYSNYIRPEARGDNLLALPGDITIADISVVHPLSINALPAAAEAAAARCDQQKRAAYGRVEPNGYPFVHFSVENKNVGRPALNLLHELGDEATGPGGVAQASSVAGTLRELSVGAISGCTQFMFGDACSNQ
jgi:hypothetical protein